MLAGLGMEPHTGRGSLKPICPVQDREPAGISSRESIVKDYVRLGVDSRVVTTISYQPSSMVATAINSGAPRPEGNPVSPGCDARNTHGHSTAPQIVPDLDNCYFVKGIAWFHGPAHSYLRSQYLQ